MEAITQLGPVLPAFLVATLLLAMLPGPATALVIRDAARGSTPLAVRTIAGTEAAIFGWALAAAFGLAALVAASEVAYTVLRVTGAVVLVGLGVQTLWNARRRATGDEADAPQRLRISGFRGGLLTNAANPKAAVFAFSFYPQFLPEHGNVLAAAILLGTIHVVVDASWYAVVVLAVSRIRHWLTRSSIRRRIEQVTGAVLVALGLRLAVERS